ncbi:putative ribonuclease H-like domain-containing protein [Tanacetum coccineum]
MQEELLQFKLQNVWVLVDLPKGHRAIGTKWVYRNKKDERGIVIRNKARLVAQGHTQEERALIMMKYLLQFEDPDHPDKVYKVVKALYGLHQAPRAWYDTLATYLLEPRIQRGQIDQYLFFKSQQEGDIWTCSKSMYDDIIFGSTKKELCGKRAYENASAVVSSTTQIIYDWLLMYIQSNLTRYHVCQFVSCAKGFRFPKNLPSLKSVKRIFRYLKGKPSLGLWYSKDSPLELVAYTDSDYAGATLDRKSTTEGAFSPQWRFLIHNILHYLSPKKTAWEPFSSNIAAAVICQEVPLFPTMLDATEPSPSPSRITSSPSPTPTPSPSPEPSHTQPSPTQPLPTQPSPTQPGTEYHLPTPHDSPLYAVHSHGSEEGSLKLQELMSLVTTLFDRIGVLEADLIKTKKTYSSAYTKLILRVKRLEAQIKVGKARRHTRVVLSDTEVGPDDSSKQGRKFSDEKVQEKASTDTELFIQEVTPTEVIQDQEASGKACDEISTAGLKKGTASGEVPIVSTAEVHLSTAGGTVTYSRRSAEKRSRQDKGKAILIEEEPKKKSKKDLEQEQLSYAEAIRLEEQMNEEQRAQIARDKEIARQWDEKERKRAMDDAKTTKKID